MNFAILNNRILFAADSIESACEFIYMKCVREDLVPNNQNTMFEIKQLREVNGLHMEVWYHFDAHYSCIHTATDTVIWSP